MLNSSHKNKLSALVISTVAISLITLSGCVNQSKPHKRGYATAVKTTNSDIIAPEEKVLPQNQETPIVSQEADAAETIDVKEEALVASVVSSEEATEATDSTKKETKEVTVATSAPLSKKVQLPKITASQAQYRPVIEIGKEAVSGKASADNEKLDKLGGCLPNSIFTDPEIFSGLSEMQSLALREAIADACRKSNADFLIAPRWELSVGSDKSDTSVTCTVFGYPAKIVDFADVTLPDPKIAALEKLLAEKDELFRAELAKKDATIQMLNEKIKILQVQPSRPELMERYLELMKKYNLDEMNDIRRILALMDEGVALSEIVPGTTTAEAEEPNVLKVKAGDITLSGNVGVSVPVEVPTVKIKVTD